MDNTKQFSYEVLVQKGIREIFSAITFKLLNEFAANELSDSIFKAMLTNGHFQQKIESNLFSTIEAQLKEARQKVLDVGSGVSTLPGEARVVAGFRNNTK